ncbi:MAG: hypothetical protein Q7I99_00330 [Acholeplasmataceae bacterium]|nr:hypothetical protein [Acholeplasmataceae bacterium]
MKKIKFVLSFAFIFLAVIAIVGCSNSVSANDTYVTLDINPSVELIVTPKERVVYANPLNADGEILLAELDLVGMKLEVAIALIIETAVELGYIDLEAEETIVSVTAISKDAAIGEKIRNQVKEHINKEFKDRALMGRAEDKGFIPEFVAEAQGYGVTPGFLRMAQSVVAANDEILLEDALQMTVEELQEVLRDAKDAKKEVVFALRAEFFEARQLIFDEYLPQIQALEASIEAQNEAIAQLEVDLAEAVEADKPAIQTELDLALENLLTLEADLEAVKTLFHNELAALRAEFHLQSEVLRAQIREMNQHRKEVNQAKVQEFMNQMQERKEQMKEAIENFQNRRP